VLYQRPLLQDRTSTCQTRFFPSSSTTPVRPHSNVQLVKDHKARPHHCQLPNSNYPKESSQVITSLPAFKRDGNSSQRVQTMGTALKNRKQTELPSERPHTKTTFTQSQQRDWVSNQPTRDGQCPYVRRTKPVRTLGRTLVQCSETVPRKVRQPRRYVDDRKS